MKIIIVTSSIKGTASHHLKYLLNNNYPVHSVIYSHYSPQKSISSKLKKIKNIGLLGAINGLRMRKWYNDRLYSKKSIPTLMEVCDSYDIELKIVEKINSSVTSRILEKEDFDLGVSLGNGYISKSIFNIPDKGFINIHHELLPDYQNAQSVIWQLYNASRYTGFTIHKINEKIDQGEILYRKEVPIIFKKSLSETVTTSYANLLDESAIGLFKLLQNFEAYENESVAQENGTKYTTPSIFEFYKIYKNYKKLRNEND